MSDYNPYGSNVSFDFETIYLSTASASVARCRLEEIPTPTNNPPSESKPPDTVPEPCVRPLKKSASDECMYNVLVSNASDCTVDTLPASEHLMRSLPFPIEESWEPKPRFIMTPSDMDRIPLEGPFNWIDAMRIPPAEIIEVYNDWFLGEIPRRINVQHFDHSTMDQFKATFESTVVVVLRVKPNIVPYFRVLRVPGDRLDAHKQAYNAIALLADIVYIYVAETIIDGHQMLSMMGLTWPVDYSVYFIPVQFF
ncbi:hypothetical protein H4R33_003557 [Dimargaris cristalligena]|nr:hypothetical protein H4R33_003557 [Dimargaris cristalligena]